MMMQAERIIPHSIEAEQSVLGAVLLREDSIDDLGALLPEHFFSQAHQEIFRTMQRMAVAGKKIDVITLAEEIERMGASESTGGLAYLGDIASNTPGAANASRYAAIVRDRSVERRLLSASVEIFDIAHGTGDVQDKLESCQRSILEISESRQTRQPRLLSDALVDFVGRTEKRRDGLMRGLSTGIDSVDAALGGGLHDGKAHLVRPCGRRIEASLSPARRLGAIGWVLHKSPYAWPEFAGQWRSSTDTKKKDSTQG